MNVLHTHHILIEAFTEATKRAKQKGAPILASVCIIVESPPSLDDFSRWHDIFDDAFYWKTHEPSLTLCGYGRAATLTQSGIKSFAGLDAGWKTLIEDAVIHGGHTPIAIGGYRFDDEKEQAEHWRGFEGADIAVPAQLLSSDGQTHRLIVQRMLGCSSNALTEANSCLASLDTLKTFPSTFHPLPPPLYSKELLPTLWQNKVERVMEGIADGHFLKVVLARETCQHHENPLPVATLLHRLEERAGNAHIFAFARGGACFLGATPERLIRIEAGRLETHALAGSIRRDNIKAVDLALAQNLINSTKDRHEHALVIQAIVDALAPHTRTLDVPSMPEVKHLPHIHHLSTPIRGELCEGTGIFDLVAALHPTPAVAGLPRPAAIHHIRDHEGFDRGWYAAPVGWVDGQGQGDFLVALRSALVRDNDCHMYAGCGIVQGSDPLAEYMETCLKLTQMREVLTQNTKHDVPIIYTNL